MEYYPKVSIIIPAYNAENYLAEAIESALGQTYNNIEIIIVNDGSVDGGATRRVAELYLSAHNGIIKYFEKENGGSSSALNFGIEKMTGEWFSWLSHDDLYYSNKIQNQIEHINRLAAKEECLWKHIFFSGADIIDSKGKCIRKQKARKMKKIENFISNISGNEYLIAKPTTYNFHGCSALINKKIFKQEGGFDENLRLLNDIDMWYRLYSAGYKVHFIPESLVMGRIHARQISTSIGYSYHNTEQDLFWNRSLDWLIKYHSNNYELFYGYGCNAFMKTRNSEGKRAFKFAAQIRPQARIKLKIEMIILLCKASVINIAKNIYLRINRLGI